MHPDAHQAADGTIDLSNGGYVPAARHADLYKGEHFPRRPNVLPPAEVVKDKPAWTEAFELRINEASRKRARRHPRRHRGGDPRCAPR